MENTLDLTLESPSYLMVPTSLVNLDIVLPHQEFWERRGLPELPSGHGPEQREYTMDGVRGLVDLDWSKWTPIFHPDDIDQDPRFSQYPYPEDDLDYDDEEEMETDYQNAPLGGAGDASMAPLTNTRCRCNCPPATYSLQPAQTPGSPQSTHTDTDTAMEMGGLSMAPGGPGTCVAPRAKATTAQGPISTPDLATTVAHGVAAAATEILERYARPPNEAECPPVNQAADAALRECLQRHLNASPWTTPGSQPASGRISVFDQLGHRVQETQQEDEWAPHPEMTPQKVERGRQPGREQDSSSRPPSQKRQSQSRPLDAADPKKGWTDTEQRPSKIQVGIDWANTGISKPIPKPDSRHPSFKSDPSGADNEPQSQMKSAVTKPKQPSGASESQDKTDSGRKKEETEKRKKEEVEKKALQMDRSPGQTFGPGWLPGGTRVVKVLRKECSQLGGPRGDVRHCCRESWKWLVKVLQFWMDEETVTDGTVYRGRVRLESSLAEYVMTQLIWVLNPDLRSLGRM